MHTMNWLETHIGAIDAAVALINGFYWNLDANGDDGGWYLLGGYDDKHILYSATSEDEIESFIYGMALAYVVLPETLRERLLVDVSAIVWASARCTSTDHALHTINRMHWGAAWVPHEGRHYVVSGTQDMLYSSDDADGATAFLYGMAMAYLGLPADALERLIADYHAWFYGLG